LDPAVRDGELRAVRAPRGGDHRPGPDLRSGPARDGDPRRPAGTPHRHPLVRAGDPLPGIRCRVTGPPGGILALDAAPDAAAIPHGLGGALGPARATPGARSLG